MLAKKSPLNGHGATGDFSLGELAGRPADAFRLRLQFAGADLGRCQSRPFGSSGAGGFI